MGVFGVVAGFFLADRTHYPACKVRVGLIQQKPNITEYRVFIFKRNFYLEVSLIRI
jgi:hypothetical protein